MFIPEKYCKSYMQWLTYSESISSLICNRAQCYMSTLIITVSIALRYVYIIWISYCSSFNCINCF
jgi:phage gp46-like protein